MADLILMSWPPKTGFLEKLITERVESVVNAVDKSLFICDFSKPLVTTKRIFLITPALAERENGFELWLLKISRLAQELSLPIHHYGDQRTNEAMIRQAKKHHLSTSLSFVIFRDWEDFLILAREIKNDDLIVFVSSRKGSASHENIHDTIPFKLEKHFEPNNKIVVYPQQYGQYFDAESFENIPSGPLSKSIESIEKGIESIFRKKDS
jgi:hypothetical protein